MCVLDVWMCVSVCIGCVDMCECVYWMCGYVCMCVLDVWMCVSVCVCACI